MASLGAQAADALAYAHSQGVLHRDVKPANLLLDLRGTVWVADFGLAKSVDADDLTHAGDVVGTLRYLAPERFDGGGDHRADVYALGLTLYELLTLRPAFAAEGRAELVKQVTAASPPNPRSVNPAVPRDLETIVLKAVARDPAARYQSASELADDLRRFTEDRPIRARRASSAEQAWRWCRRNPAVASLLAAVLIVFAAGAGASAYFAAEEGRRAKEAADNAEEATQKSALAAEREGEAKRERNRANDEAKRVREKLDFISGLLHVSRINHAQTALAEERVPRVRQLLADAAPAGPGEPDLRGWEWHYLDRLVRGRVLAEIRPTVDFPPRDPGRPKRLTPADQLKAVSPESYFATSADGRRVVLGRPEGDGVVLEVWDARSNRLVGRVPRTGSLAPADLQRVALAPDGRYVAALEQEQPVAGEKRGRPPRQVRVWEVETGTEAAPQYSVGLRVPWVGTEVAVGPGAAWVPWPDERSSRAVPPPHLAGGESHVQDHLTQDGKFQYRVTGFGKLPPDYRDSDDLVPKDWKLEAWDLSASPPRPRWPAVALAQNCRRVATAFARGGEAAAACDGREVAVYRLSDAKVLWRSPVSGPGDLFGVSDDGSRVAFQAPYRITVLEGGPAGVRELRFRRAEGESRHAHLAGDGRTVLIHTAANRVQVMDVSRDPALAAPGEGPRLTRPGPLRPEANPCVVLDAAGKEVLRVDPPPAQSRQPAEGSRMWGGRHAGPPRLSASLVADDRRLLTNGPRPGAGGGIGETRTGLVPEFGSQDEWALYDVTRPGAGRVGGGRGEAVPAPGTPWLVVSYEVPMIFRWEGERSGMLASSRRTFTLHSALTGERLHEIATPGEGPCESGPPVFDPTGTRYAVATLPAPEPAADGRPARAGGPVTLRVREAATGREVLSAVVGDVRTGQVGGGVFFD
ncbi:MAG TPA: serine/threonine-protein kinase, partial [Gemmataceae bacterium]|nr:serine/threonine-protein kinase [Gemmataceae bacterium]